MRLLFRLPPVKPDAFQAPQICPYPGCKGRHFQQVQEVPKPLRDIQYQEVTAQRYRCLRCGRTFTVAGPLESVGAVDPVSGLERAKR